MIVNTDKETVDILLGHIRHSDMREFAEVHGPVEAFRRYAEACQDLSDFCKSVYAVLKESDCDDLEVFSGSSMEITATKSVCNKLVENGLATRFDYGDDEMHFQDSDGPME